MQKPSAADRFSEIVEQMLAPVYEEQKRGKFVVYGGNLVARQTMHIGSERINYRHERRGTDVVPSIEAIDYNSFFGRVASQTLFRPEGDLLRRRYFQGSMIEVSRLLTPEESEAAVQFFGYPPLNRDARDIAFAFNEEDQASLAIQKEARARSHEELQKGLKEIADAERAAWEHSQDIILG